MIIRFQLLLSIVSLRPCSTEVRGVQIPMPLSQVGRNAVKSGETLVAKETLYLEQLQDSVFHVNMCKVQAEAQAGAAAYAESIK